MIKRKNVRGNVKGFACLLLAVMAAYLIFAACAPPAADGFASVEAAVASAVPEDWRLILVNRDHVIPSGYEVTLLELSNGQKVDERIYPELQQMFDDARAGGLDLTVREGFRSHEAQVEIMENRVSRFREQGFSESEARQKAGAEVAEPGTSEHELGLAVDINSAGDTDQWALYGWLAENSWKYGFILRYPPDKEEITGITYEPWHYRYVGKDAAKEIYDRRITLEEYLSE